MTTSRKDVLSQALEFEVGGARNDASTLFTDDVVGWSPIVTVSGLKDVADLAGVRDDHVLERRHHVPGARRGGQQGIR